jgi:hypothetical protein
MLKSAWPDWKVALMIFQPETVIGWQQAGFRLFWRWKSRHRLGRPGKDAELIQLIRRMWSVNPTWGSPRIRDELAKLGLYASTATIRKYRPKSRRRPAQSWSTFLRNHAGAIAAMDFFLVPTVIFRRRCCYPRSFRHPHSGFLTPHSSALVPIASTRSSSTRSSPWRTTAGERMKDEL